jgi:hypothetical protein
MTEHKQHLPIEVSLDQRKFLRANFSSWLIGVGLGLVSFFPWRRTSILTRLPTGLARLLFVAWLWFVVPTFFKSLLSTPIVIVDETGIAYHLPPFGPFNFSGSLSWDKIEALYIGELPMAQKRRPDPYRFLCILPKDAEAYLQPYTLFNKTVLTMLIATLKTPFAIPQHLLQLTSDQLLERIQTDYADILQSNAIEIREPYTGSFVAFQQPPDAATPWS